MSQSSSARPVGSDPFAKITGGPAAPPPPPPPPPLADVSTAAQEPAWENKAIPPTLPATVEGIVQIALAHDFSDIHLGVGEEPRFRNRGEIVRTGWPVTDKTTFREWLRQILEPSDIDVFNREKEYDGSYSFSFVRVRINVLETVRGSAMVLRLIPTEMPTIERLHLPSQLKGLAERSKGLILIAGPTGSGKTTTLAAIIHHINTTMKRHILMIEDPVEFVHESQLSLVRQREVGLHTKLFSTALRASLREDPDVILLGEIRDRESLSTAIEASQAGHLVLGALHTNSVVRTMEWILGMYPAQEQEMARRTISESLLAILSQGLIKTTDGKQTGCYEFFVNTDDSRESIESGQLDDIEATMSRGSPEGMITMDQSLARLVEQGRVTPEEAMRHSLKPNEFSRTWAGRA